MSAPIPTHNDNMARADRLIAAMLKLLSEMQAAGRSLTDNSK